jgi:hypothetical protein
MKDITEFQSNIHRILDQGNYCQAKQLLIIELQNAKQEDNNYLMLLAEIAGFLIDIGAESIDEEATKMGIDILKRNEGDFKQVLTEQSYNYCLGNGAAAMYKIEKLNIRLPSLDQIKPNLIEAKNYYFKAYKDINVDELTTIDLQILTNLGNNLTQAGRIIEAIRLYKSVLKLDTKFPQALIGYADDLDYWIKISACPESISLYTEIYTSYETGLESATLPPAYKIRIENSILFYKNLLEELDFDISTIKKELQITESEYEKHTDFRKFCIDNLLTLNEHALFCKCKDSNKDDLSVVHSKITLYGDKVGEMELLLNRLKSEFNLAKKLFYEGTSYKTEDSEVLYSDLFDDELIGDNVEKIRTSFKLCFGIFDKIAHGICYFLDLPKGKRDKIYFDRFWNDNKERWSVLKGIKNPHLVALYSIANDLNGLNGEFGFYRHWRNKLEHGNLILVRKENHTDLLKLFKDDAFVTRIPFNFFKEQALHLLQICCASIYSYTYFVRMESLHKDENKLGVPFIIQPKSY